MILFFKARKDKIFIIVETTSVLREEDFNKLNWLFGNTELLSEKNLEGFFIGPRKEMLTPWSTNAVEITRNMGITGINRIEEFCQAAHPTVKHDPMLQAVYHNITQEIFSINIDPEPMQYISDIAAYNLQHGLALNQEEMDYLKEVSRKMNRQLTDTEVFGFSQVNSEHCRHKIFNARFILNGIEQPASLFDLIKKTTKLNRKKVVSAYSDNVAFLKGPPAELFAPVNQDQPDYFIIKNIQTSLSLKAETHNFPTTVEPFYGASTGSGGEIRDRMAGGKASIPMAGTAIYMTAYPRLEQNRPWEKRIQPRAWLYQSPLDILIKASNGASDFGNKFGQPLICGSILTFEHEENQKLYSYDKVIMLAGGIGFARAEDCLKALPQQGDTIVLLGGDNYRIGMGGGAVSSVATGEYDSALELNAVQRANPEMQKRVFNTIRALAEAEHNPIISNHDHGAGGHLNCLSELVENLGGTIDMTKLPVGDPTLSDKEIIGNESQERMGLILKEQDLQTIRRIAERERTPLYIIGKVTGDKNLVFINKEGQKPMDIKLDYLFGKPPKTIIRDSTAVLPFLPPVYTTDKIQTYIRDLLQLEAVACKDWLTNKVDRSVTGKVAMQQTAGILQLPLNNLGIVAIDYRGTSGIATSLGHAPVAGLIDSAAGSCLSVAEALTNLVWVPLQDGLDGVSLSANWMWPCKQPGEDVRLYQAVQALSDFAIALGINIPTGKDSLSMIQKYENDKIVYAPGTVIISAIGEVTELGKRVSPVIKSQPDSLLLYINFSGDQFKLGGSSFAQMLNQIGGEVPTIPNPQYFKKAFNTIQQLIENQLILAGHDVAAGGLLTTLLEMHFANTSGGMEIDLRNFQEADPVKILFSENPGIVIQIANQSAKQVINLLETNQLSYLELGTLTSTRFINLILTETVLQLDIDDLRDTWYRTSWLLDQNQSGVALATKRFTNYKQQPLKLHFQPSFSGKTDNLGIQLDRGIRSQFKAAIIREKGINGDREMAYAMYLAGFDVKDVHMTDLISGRETLDEIRFIVFPGGFSNSDVLGSAKGWAGAFIYNPKARLALEKFYLRKDTLSLGVCNGCQLMVNLGLIYPEHEQQPTMAHNDSHKFESAFLSVTIHENGSIMLKSLAGSRLGIWVAHGEGKFCFPYPEDSYEIPLKYCYQQYPGNPNGSALTAAGICSHDGRHLAMMPHLERAIFPWQWAYYPEERQTDQITPWLQAFINAREWVQTHH